MHIQSHANHINWNYMIVAHHYLDTSTHKSSRIVSLSLLVVLKSFHPATPFRTLQLRLCGIHQLNQKLQVIQMKGLTRLHGAVRCNSATRRSHLGIFLSEEIWEERRISDIFEIYPGNPCSNTSPASSNLSAWVEIDREKKHSVQHASNDFNPWIFLQALLAWLSSIRSSGSVHNSHLRLDLPGSAHKLLVANHLPRCFQSLCIWWHKTPKEGTRNVWNKQTAMKNDLFEIFMNQSKKPSKNLPVLKAESWHSWIQIIIILDSSELWYPPCQSLGTGCGHLVEAPPALRLPWCSFQKPGAWSDPAPDMVFWWGFIKKTGGAGFLETMVIVVMIVIVMMMGRTAQAQSYSWL